MSSPIVAETGEAAKLIKMAHDAGILLDRERDLLLSLIAPKDTVAATQGPPKLMKIETATVPNGFTTVSTSSSQAIVFLNTGNIYYRCADTNASTYWAVVRGKVPRIYDTAEDSLAQVSGVSNCLHHSGFTTQEEAAAYIESFMAKKEACWGVMLCQLRARAMQKRQNRIDPSDSADTEVHTASPLQPWDIRSHDAIAGVDAPSVFQSPTTFTSRLNLILPQNLTSDSWQLHLAHSTWWNAKEHGRFLTYDPTTQTIVVAPYPALASPTHPIPLTIPQLVQFVFNGYTNNGHREHRWISCLCGPIAGNWDTFTPIQVFAIQDKHVEGSKTPEYVLGCRNRQGGCGYHVPLGWIATGFRPPADPVACFRDDVFCGFPRRVKLPSVKIWYDHVVESGE
ncbi:hypothetical protein ARMSODRAFT_1018823 [Armillaria solidipes]|uniref:Ribonuclease H1 N-terminal domain-containing protein n=1 Tax=Armillaria solidipes TaxID=1076256 RepID=A0A2H3C284_9AGAR|nr:hypothetical protein ARMSODRAFT_1018823 [Armillaria solidipes]